jgi:hypothetical protein
MPRPALGRRLPTAADGGCPEPGAPARPGSCRERERGGPGRPRRAPAPCRRRGPDWSAPMATKRVRSRTRARAVGTMAIAAGGFSVGSLAMAGGLLVASPDAFDDHSGLSARHAAASDTSDDSGAAAPAARTSARPVAAASTTSGPVSPAAAAATTALAKAAVPSAPYRFEARQAPTATVTRRTSRTVVPKLAPIVRTPAKRTIPAAPKVTSAPKRTSVAPRPNTSAPSRHTAPPPVSSTGS